MIMSVIQMTWFNYRWRLHCY